jgi:hypothetical protein
MGWHNGDPIQKCTHGALSPTDMYDLDMNFIFDIQFESMQNDNQRIKIY